LFALVVKIAEFAILAVKISTNVINAVGTKVASLELNLGVAAVGISIADCNPGLNA
jgi:hypothetical protein